MGATAAHRALERVTDGTCTQVWAWMTNKCRRRMNGRKGYIITKISQRRTQKNIEREREREEGRRLQFLELLKPLAAKHQGIEKKKN